MEGVWQISASYDTAGAMTKTVLDLAHVSDILLKTTEKRVTGQSESLVDYIRNNWQGMSVGFVDIERWRLPLEVRDPVSGYIEQTVSFSKS